MRINGAAFFKQSFELIIKGDLIPDAAAEEIMGELQALFARHNAGAALSAKAVFKPTKEFHTDRAEVTALSFQTSGLSFFFHGASRGEREDEARAGRIRRRLIRSGTSGALNPDIPIIAITANAFPSNADACKLAGMNDYLTKPVSAVALREVVQKWAQARFDEDKVYA